MDSSKHFVQLFLNWVDVNFSITLNVSLFCQSDVWCWRVHEKWFGGGSTVELCAEYPACRYSGPRPCWGTSRRFPPSGSIASAESCEAVKKSENIVDVIWIWCSLFYRVTKLFAYKWCIDYENVSNCDLNMRCINNEAFFPQIPDIYMWAIYRKSVKTPYYFGFFLVLNGISNLIVYMFHIVFICELQTFRIESIFLFLFITKCSFFSRLQN